MCKLFLALFICIASLGAQSFPVTPEQAQGMWAAFEKVDPLAAKEIVLLSNYAQYGLTANDLFQIQGNNSVIIPQTIVRFAPVRITTRPESISTLYPVLHAKNFGVHNIQLCNASIQTVTVPLEQVIGALPDFPYLPYDQAEILAANSYQHNPKLMVARIGEYAALVATGVMAGGTASSVLKISPKAIALVAVGIPLFHTIGDKLKGEVPPISQFSSQIIQGDTVLSPAGQKGYCVSKLILSSKIPSNKLKSYDVTVSLPY